MPALFRPVDTNVGVIAMGGSASVELCRMNVRTGVVTSSLLPSSWTIQVTDNLLKLINWTQESERDKPEFLRMLMAAMDSSGQPTAFLLPSPINSQGVVVVTLTAATPNDVVLLYVPRTDEAGFLLASGGGGGGGPGEDSYARAQVAALAETVATKADASALAGKADAAHNHDDRYSLLGHTHSGYALTGHTHSDYALASDLSSKADASAIIDYAAATGGGLSRTSVGPNQREFAVDATVPRMAAAIVSADVAPALTQALVLDPASGTDGSYEFKLVSVATKAAVDAKASATDIKTYNVTADGGLVRAEVKNSSDVVTGYTFGVDTGVVRVATPPSATTDLGKALVVSSAGGYELADVATQTELQAVSAGIKYKDAVEKRVALVTDIAGAGLTTGQRVLVDSGASAIANGVYEKTAAGYARAADFTGVSVAGAYVFVRNADGAGNGASYICTTAAPNDVAGTNALAFTQYAAGKTYSALTGGGLTLSSSNAFSVNFAKYDSTATADATKNDLPLMDGTATSGNGTAAARWNHVHPSDTSRLATAGGTLTGVVTYDTATNAALTSVTATPDGKTLASVDYVSAKVASGAAAGVPFATTASAGKVIVGTGLSVVTTAGATQGTVSVAYGAAANTATQGNDVRLNYAPVGAADKGKLAVISSAGTWATVAAPTSPSADTVMRWDTTSGMPVWGTAASYTLPTASATVLGVVKVGTGLTINATTGVLAVDFTGYATTTSLSSYLTSTVASSTYATKTELAAVPYDIAGSVFGSLTASDKPFFFVAPRNMKIVNNANVNFRVLTPGTSGNTTLDLKKQPATGTPVTLGTITFASGSNTGSYVAATGLSNVALAAGEYVYLEVTGTPDAALKTIFFTIGGTVG